MNKITIFKDFFYEEVEKKLQEFINTPFQDKTVEPLSIAITGNNEKVGGYEYVIYLVWRAI